MDQKNDWNQLTRYFADELSFEEHRKMEAWIDADPVRKERVLELYEIWNRAGAASYDLDTDKAWETLAGKMDRYEREKLELAQPASGKVVGHIGLDGDHHRSVRTSQSRPWRVAMVAAIALIVLTVGMLTSQYTFEPLEPMATEEASPGRELITQDGEQAIYIFGDGSKVYLHAGSRLEVPDSFNSENRELFLEGAAYFEVAHNPDKPFIVHTNQAYTRVLGTRFMVQAWPESRREVEVIVSEGKVEFGGNDESTQTGRGNGVVVTRNQKGVLSGAGTPSISDVTDMDWYLGWTEGRLVFNDRPLKDVVPKLERWYAVRIVIGDPSTGEKRITGEIDHSQPMREVMESIALSLELDLELGDRTVTFHAEE